MNFYDYEEKCFMETIFDYVSSLFPAQVHEFNKVENILVLPKNVAIERCMQDSTCIAVFPTINGFEEVWMTLQQNGVYSISTSRGKYPVFYKDGCTDNKNGIFSDYCEVIRSVVQYAQHINELCICQYRGERDRMYLLPTSSDVVLTKSGWWDTFCLKKDAKIAPIANKRYLCHVVGMRLDKVGHIIALVSPFFALDEDSEIDGYIFAHSNRFVSNFQESVGLSFMERVNQMNLNYAAAFSVPFEEFENDPYNAEIQEKIHELLHSPTNAELELLSLKEAAKSNPMVAAKIEKYGLHKYADIVRDSYFNLHMAGLVPDAHNFGEQAVLCINYYAEKKASEKAARKAAKAARKISAKA